MRKLVSFVITFACFCSIILSSQRALATTWIDNIPALPYTVPFTHDFGSGSATYDNYFFYQNSGAIVLVYVAQGYTFPNFINYSGYLTAQLGSNGSNLQSFRLSGGQWNTQGNINWLDPDKNSWPFYPSCPLFYTTIDFYFSGDYDYGSEYCNLGHLTTGKFFTANILPAFQLSVAREPEAGGGVASSDDEIQCGYNSNNYCQFDYPINSEVELTAYPNTGYAFSNWEWNGGASSSTNNPETFVMSEAEDVVAVFKPLFTFPLYGYSQTTVPISAVMDHSLTGGFYSVDGRDDKVEAFNGEVGDAQYGVQTTDGVRGYMMNENEDLFLTGYTYTEPKKYLFYDEHPGFDFAVVNGTNVLAPFSGKLYWATTDPVNGSPSTYGTFYIDHENGYTSWFLHCSGLTSAVAAEVIQNGYAVVTKGDHIAESSDKGSSGNSHLHFEVRKGGVDDEHVIDPYGWELWED